MSIKYVFNPLSGELDSVLNLDSPLQFKGDINISSDFPTLVEVQDGWFYTVSTDVTDNDASKTNTGDSFLAGDEIAWNGTGWSLLGNLGTFTEGSIAFGGADRKLTEDNANLFFDDTNNRLGIGINSPATLLHLNEAGSTDNALIISKGDLISAQGLLSFQDSVGTEFFGMQTDAVGRPQIDFRTMLAFRTGTVSYLSIQSSEIIAGTKIRPGADYTHDLGASTRRWNDLYIGKVLNEIELSTDVGVTVKGAALQSANLQEWQDSTSTVLTAITHEGNIIMPNSFFIGGGTHTLNATYATAIGHASVADSSYATALGYKARANLGSYGQMALGSWSIAEQTASTAVGYGANAIGNSATGIGYNAKATVTTATALGTGAIASATGAFAAGPNATASDVYALALGRLSVASAEGAVAIGFSADATAAAAFALGSNAQATGPSTFALGDTAVATGTASIAVGKVSTSDTAYGLAFGYSASATLADYGQVVIGSWAEAEQRNANAFGYGAWAKGQGAVSVGAWAKSTATQTIAIGPSAEATVDYGIALGYETDCNHNAAVVIGRNAASEADNMLVMGSSSFPLDLNVYGNGKFNIDGSTDVGLTVKGAVAQSANLLEIQDSSGINHAYVTNEGKLIFRDAVEQGTSYDPDIVLNKGFQVVSSDATKYYVSGWDTVNGLMMSFAQTGSYLTLSQKVNSGILRLATDNAAGTPISLIDGRYNYVVFNESGVDVDFRVESAVDTHSLFVQGSDGNVGIGTSSPAELLEVRKDQNTDTTLRIKNSGEGTASVTKLEVFGDAGVGLVTRVQGSSFTDSGLFTAGSSVMYHTGLFNGDFNLGMDGTGKFNIFTGGVGPSNIRMTILDTGQIGIGTDSPNSTLQVEGSVSLSIATQTTATLTLDVYHHTILCDTTSNDITITLPTAASASGRIYNIKKIDSVANSITVDGSGAETIDGATTQVIANQWDCMKIQSNGSSWFIL